jgi:uncharacterized protein (DUF488 family)
MNTLYTLGYTGIRPAQLLAKADALGALVLDIRYSPRSRVGQWTGTELNRLLGLRYRHLPELGNVNYKEGGPIEINMPTVGVQQVVSILNTQPAILLCACPDVDTCHRKIVAEMMQAKCGCEVIHLTAKDLTLETQKPQQLDLF